MTYNRLEELNKMKVTIFLLEQLLEKLRLSYIELRESDRFGYTVGYGASIPEDLRMKFLNLTSLELEQKKKEFAEI